jgi:hypothetical protein
MTALCVVEPKIQLTGSVSTYKFNEDVNNDDGHLNKIQLTLFVIMN